MSGGSVRNYAVLYLGARPSGGGGATLGGGNVLSSTAQHKLDGVEHLAADDSTRLDATADRHGLLPKLSGDPDDVLGGDGAWANRLARLRAISPTTLAANTDNWNPTGLATADVIRVATDASRNLTGITAPAVGRALLLLNVGAFDLVLKDDVTSTAANRFFLPYGDVTLVPDAGAELWYDVTSARWRIVAVVTSAGASFGTPAVTYGTPAAGAASTAIRTDAVLPAPNKVVLTLTNKVGSAVAAGDVVKVNTGTDESFNSTTTGQAEVSIGIVQEAIADNASGRVLVSGYAALVNVPASVTRGHYVETHTVAKQAVGNSSRHAGSFGQFLTGGTTPSAILWGQTDQTASSSGLTDPMTTRGDIIVRDSSNVTARLAVGSSGKVLSSDGTDVSWQTPSGSSFSYPGSVEGLFAHYKADAISGKSNGDTLTEWRNSAPLTPGHDLVAEGSPTYQTSIVNGLPVVRLGGSAYFRWSLPLMVANKPWTLFIVHKMSSITPTYTGLWGFGWADAGGLFVKSNGKTALYAPGSIYDGTGAITYGTVNWNYTTLVMGQTATTRRSGSADVTATALGASGALGGQGFLGTQAAAGRTMSGDIAEVLLYARVLTSTEISAVETYITGKYSI